MLDIHTICVLGEIDFADLFELVVFVILLIGGLVAKKVTEAKKKRELQERAAQRSQSSQADDSQDWHKVESTELQREEFLANAKERKLERQKRVRMLKRKLEEGVSDFEHEVAPLPSEIEESQASSSLHEYSHQDMPEFVRNEPVAVTPPPLEPATPVRQYASSNADTTHRLLKDTKYNHTQEQTRAVEVDLSGADKLRQAIVLSEVLGKPKALRSESGYWDI